MDLDKHLSISEFARLSGIKRKNLIYYDKIGLFSPEIKKENKYRLYTYRQLAVIAVICALKEAGIPLKGIKSYLDKRTPDNLIQLFTKQNRAIEKEIKKLTGIQSMVKARIEITKKSKIIDPNKILLEECEEETLLLSSPLEPANTNSTLDSIINFYELCVTNGVYFGYPIGTIICNENLVRKKWNQPSYHFIRLNEKNSFLTAAVKPRGLYAVAYSSGYYGSLDELYGRTFDFIDKNGLRVCGSSYEEFLLDEIAAKKPEEYLIQIAIQVERKL